MARLDGVHWVGDTEVPRYVPARGESIDHAAASLGLRVLGRREEGDVVAVIIDAGLPFRCARQTRVEPPAGTAILPRA